MDIFENSVLSSLDQKGFEYNSDDYVPGIQSDFTQNDMRLWMDKVTAGTHAAQRQSTKVQEHIFNILHMYASGDVTSDKLVDVVKLENLGFNAQLINHLYKYTCEFQEYDNENSKFQSVFMSIFLNTHGVFRAVDIINALCMSIDLRKRKKPVKSPDEVVIKENCTEIGSLRIHDIIEKCQKNHRTNLSVQNIISSQVNDIKGQIQETIICKVPHDETFLTTVSRIVQEPKYAIAKFSEAVAGFELIEHSESHKSQLHTMMKSRNVNLETDFPVLKKELFTLMLPYSWTLTDMDSTIVLDILLNVMLGCKSEVIRSFIETVEFTFISQIYLSDTILNNIDIMMKCNNYHSEKDIITLMVRIWKQASAFVAFMGLFRLVFPDYNNITVGKTDNFNSYEQFDTEQQERFLAVNCIYLYKSNFYLSFKNKQGNMHKIKSSSFHELFYQILNR